MKQEKKRKFFVFKSLKIAFDLVLWKENSFVFAFFLFCLIKVTGIG